MFDVGFALVIFPFVGFEAEDGNILVFAIVSGLAEAHILLIRLIALWKLLVSVLY